MDTSQMQTPPPTRHATSRAGLQQSGGRDFATPVTVVQRTPGQIPTADGLFNQTPFGYPSLQFSPEMLQFSNTGPMSAPPLPHSRLFWDQPNDGSQMDVDMPLASDPFGPTPHKIEGNVNWSTFHTPASNAQMNPRPFQTLHGMSSPGPMTSFASNAGGANLKPNSFVSPSGGVDPSMLFSFSSPRPAASFDHSAQPPKQAETRQPYETQLRDSLKEKEIVRQAKSQHSRTSTNSSVASFELSKPGLQRSNTDSGFRNSRPTSIDSRSPASTGGFNIPRRSSPLKRQSGGSLTAIPEMRRPKTRLIIDETGRARTETVPVEEDEMMGADARKDPHPQKDLRRQYPGLWADDESDTDEDEPATLSRNASFNIPQRRPPKHARADSGDLTRSNSFKIPRPSSGVFDKSTFETVRPVRRVADGVHRRFSMMDLPTSFNETEDSEDQTMPDSPGDALGALKKVVGDRQKRTDRVAQNALRAHNQRWAQASADLANVASYDPFTNSFIGSPNTADTGLTTPSTDRGSLSGDSTRCVCNGSDDGRSMVQCESCNKWLHMGCVGLTQNNLPPVYVCVFCTGQTPVARGGRVRGPMPAPFDSPLTHKSVFRRS
ncbi:hypothetical protein P280DRAFT_287743 [Massarina eburnea CBS 473.64]|uniref:PHD-type domain-containing protein n=1 Tax=Massarina eburnea CBS 473.64 TaxID=1395130 RepID=A0A6A6S6U9_9PLEO|nr:hypothetical protein P280DRAFT_287743 [Massarina eburnea CBS 473.64]